MIVAAFVYHIERTPPGFPPYVELVDFQKYKPQPARRTQAQSQQGGAPPSLSGHPVTPPLASSSFHAPPYGSSSPGPMLHMDYSLPMQGGHPVPNATLVETYTFDTPSITPSMYRTGSSPPQVTATASANMIYSSPR